MKSLKFDNKNFNTLLDKFQEGIDKKKYTERIPYDLWRKMRSANFITVDYVNGIVSVSNGAGKLVSFKNYDYGFGRFFWDEYVKEKDEDMAMSSCNVALAAESAKNYFDATKVTGSNYTNNIDVHTIGTLSADSASNYTLNTDWNTTTTLSYSDSAYGYRTLSEVIEQVPTKSDLDELAEKIKKLENNYNNKENNKMKGFNFDFGPCNPNVIHMSMYGLAIKNASGSWVSFDKNTNSIMDVDVFNFDGGKYFYKMPVAVKDIQAGDVIIHANKPMFVKAVTSSFITAIDPVDGEIKDIMITRSPFGFNFATKIISLFDNMCGGTPSADQPFGNMLPLLLMNGDNKDMDPMMLMFMMSQGANMFSNPMMMYFLMKDNKNFDPMMLIAMNGGFYPNPVAAVQEKCECGCGCANGK